jgi:hypothetical protein
MVVIFSATDGLDNFRCVRNDQSYYLAIDMTTIIPSTFSILRFSSRGTTKKNYTFPGRRSFLKRQGSWILEDNYIAFFFERCVLRFDLLTENFREIPYLRRSSQNVSEIYQTADYFYVEYTNALGSSHSSYIPKSNLTTMNNIDIDIMTERTSYKPVNGVNNFIVSNDRFVDLSSRKRDITTHIKYIAIFDSPPAKLYSFGESLSRFIEIGNGTLQTYCWNMYVDAEGYRYDVFTNYVNVYKEGILITKIDIGNSGKVFADAQCVYVFYGFSKILILEKKALANYRYVDIGNSSILSDLCSHLDDNTIFVNGPGLPLCQSRVPSFYEVYPYLEFLDQIDSSTKVYLINSRGLDIPMGFFQFVDCNITETKLLEKIRDAGNYIIFDLDTHLFL